VLTGRRTARKDVRNESGLCRCGLGCGDHMIDSPTTDNSRNSRNIPGGFCLDVAEK